MQRDVSIDFTRAVAIVIIVTAHFLSFGGICGANSVGHYLGEVGNSIFFAVSALLFGTLYEKKGNTQFSFKPFMYKRLKRLFASLWPFLVVIVTLYLSQGVYMSPLKVAMNFAGLGWFGKLPGNGHLWFVTMIIFCYLMYVAYCMISNKFNIKLNCKWGGVILLITIVLQIILDRIHLPGMVFLILFYSLLLFKNSTKVRLWINNVSWWILVPLTIGLNSVALTAHVHSPTINVSILHWIGYIAGFSLFMLLMKIGKHAVSNKIIMLFSLTGYEIYLVHHCLCCGTLSIIHASDCVLLNYCILWVCTIGAGWLLKRVGERVNDILGAVVEN